MANVKREHRIAKIHMAAGFFAVLTRDAEEIGEYMKMSARNVIRYSKESEWQTALEAVGYTGDRTFRVNRHGRDPERNNPELFQKAKAVYLENAKTATSGWQASVATAAALDLIPRTVWNWAKRYGWNDATKAEIGE